MPAGYLTTESMLVLNDLSDAYRPDFAVLFLDGDTPTSGTSERGQLNSIDFAKDVAVSTDRVLERNLTLVTLVVKIYHSGLS
jgi:23S rRNA U2552 (ribose-2'-O)-methylase RlmE/FtsJ